MRCHCPLPHVCEKNKECFYSGCPSRLTTEKMACPDCYKIKLEGEEWIDEVCSECERDGLEAD